MADFTEIVWEPKLFKPDQLDVDTSLVDRDTNSVEELGRHPVAHNVCCLQLQECNAKILLGIALINENSCYQLKKNCVSSKNRLSRSWWPWLALMTLKEGRGFMPSQNISQAKTLSGLALLLLRREFHSAGTAKACMHGGQTLPSMTMGIKARTVKRALVWEFCWILVIS